MAMSTRYIILVIYLCHFETVWCQETSNLHNNPIGAQGLHGTKADVKSKPKHTTKNDSPVARIPKMDFGPTFVGPPSDGRTSDVLGFNVAKGIPSSDPVGPITDTGGSAFPFAPSMPLIPLPDYSSTTQNRAPLQNQPMPSVFGNRPLRDDTVYVKVKIIHRKPSLRESMRSFCQLDYTDSYFVDVKAEGRNYIGRYDDYAMINTRRGVSSAVVPMAVKLRGDLTSEVLISAQDGCGRACQARCVDRRYPTKRFTNCDGLMRINRSNSTAEMQFLCPLAAPRNWGF